MFVKSFFSNWTRLFYAENSDRLLASLTNLQQVDNFTSLQIKIGRNASHKVFSCRTRFQLRR